jgi:hypothetical protein
MSWVGIAVLTLGVFLLRLDQMAHQGLYGDELYTYQQVPYHSFTAMMRAIRPPGENAPPLFFVLAWLSCKLGSPSVLIRLPSLLLGVATIPVLYALGVETLGRVAGLLGAGMFALSPFSTYYGIEARPYAGMAFFVALATLAAVKAVRTSAPAWWVLYTLAAAGAAYTGYTAVFALLVLGVWSIWAARLRWRWPVLANLAVVVLYLPWLPRVGSKELEIIGALEPFTAYHVGRDLLRAFVGYPDTSLTAIPLILGLVVIGAVALVGAGYLLRLARRGLYVGNSLGLLCAVALAAPVGLILYSLLSTDIWDARDLYSAEPAAALIFGGLLAAIPARVRMFGAAAVLAVLIVGTAKAVSPRYSRPPFREAASYIDARTTAGDPIIILPSYLGLANDLAPELTGRHQVIFGDVPPAVSSGANGVLVTVGEPGLSGELSAGPMLARRGYRLTARRSYRGLFPFIVSTYESRSVS